MPARSIIEAATLAGSVPIFRLNGYTAGSHGFDGREEFGASNPIEHAPIETEITPEEEQQLLGLTCAVVPISVGGSFHEQWIIAQAYVRIPHEHPLVERAETEETTKERSVRGWPIDGPLVFEFKGVKDAVTRVRQLCKASTPDFPEDRETWWGREIEKAKLRQPRTYSGD